MGTLTNSVTGLPSECGSGQNTDAYGVPADGTTPLGAPIPYAGPGVLSPAVNAAIALCGVNPDLFRPYQGVSGIDRHVQTASSSYNALQFSLRHTVGGLALNLAYTYSHSIDDASSGLDTYFPNAYNLERASSNFDQRHLFSLSYVYDLPFFKAKGLRHNILGGWEWSGITIIQSGSPFSVGNQLVGDNAGVGNTVASLLSTPDVVGDPRSGIPSLNGVNGFGPALFNPSAFAAPRGLTFGDTPRNFLNDPRRTNFDMAVFKRFALGEKAGLEFRAEAFNVFNHTEFAWLGGGQGSAASNSPFSSPTSSATCYDLSCGFLQAGAAHNPRILQLALKLMF